VTQKHDGGEVWSDVAGTSSGPRATVGLALPEIQHRLSQLGATVRRLERAVEAPEQALEATPRQLGHEATRATVALLPAAARIPSARFLISRAWASDFAATSPATGRRVAGQAAAVAAACARIIRSLVDSARICGQVGPRSSHNGL